ncbi:MAG: SCO1664 family protein [Actinomycetota bacterium]
MTVPPGIPPVLADGDLELLGLLPRSSNYAFLARATLGEEEMLAVYKPRRGENPLWDFPDGTLCNREAAAFVIAHALGWPNVPPTLLRSGPEGEGAVQRFIPFEPAEHAFTLQERFPAAFRRLALFDVVANNADRKSGHCLLGRDGELFVVDHGTCFSEEPKLRTVLWDYVDEPISPGDSTDLGRLHDTLGFGPTRARLDELLSAAEVRALIARLDALVAAGRFPEPGPGRPYPWPMV